MKFLRSRVDTSRDTWWSGTIVHLDLPKARRVLGESDGPGDKTEDEWVFYQVDEAGDPVFDAEGFRREVTLYDYRNSPRFHVGSHGDKELEAGFVEFLKKVGIAR